MAWIESHQELRNHPKLYSFSELLGIEKPKAIGHLHLLWWWCIDYAIDGILPKNHVQIARAAEFLGDSEKFIDALIKSGFVENRENFYEIHDWLDFCGSLVDKRLQRKKERKKAASKKRRMASKRKDMVSNRTVPTVPNRTVPITPEQVENLLGFFENNLRNKIEIYLDRVAKMNKSKTITDGRKITILNELINSRDRCADDGIFGYALDESIGRDACNIGYVNAIIKNKKTKKEEDRIRDRRAYHDPV